jgi:hypothetical protein
MRFFRNKNGREATTELAPKSLMGIEDKTSQDGNNNMQSCCGNQREIYD